MGPTVSLDVLSAISWTSLLIDGFEVVDMITMMDVNDEDAQYRGVHVTQRDVTHHMLSVTQGGSCRSKWETLFILFIVLIHDRTIQNG